MLTPKYSTKERPGSSKYKRKARVPSLLDRKKGPGLLHTKERSGSSTYERKVRVSSPLEAA